MTKGHDDEGSRPFYSETLHRRVRNRSRVSKNSCMRNVGAWSRSQLFDGALPTWNLIMDQNNNVRFILNRTYSNIEHEWMDRYQFILFWVGYFKHLTSQTRIDQAGEFIRIVVFLYWNQNITIALVLQVCLDSLTTASVDVYSIIHAQYYQANTNHVKLQ